MSVSICDVCFTPESGHSPTRSGCLLWANKRHLRRSKQGALLEDLYECWERVSDVRPWVRAESRPRISISSRAMSDMSPKCAT
jgi:hypothetical protein